VNNNEDRAMSNRIARPAIALAALVALTATACREQSNSVAGPSATTVRRPPGGRANLAFMPYAAVCKVGSNGTFAVAYDDYSGSPAQSTLQVAAGTCENLPFPLDSALVQVTEQVASGYQLDSIVRDSMNFSTNDSLRAAKLTGTLTQSLHLNADGVPASVGGVLTFYNSPVVVAAFSGCSPGYWKQTQHFHSYRAPYAPTTLFVTAFGVNAFPGKTLLQVLSTGGGGLTALGRQIVAALLNSNTTSLNYNWSTAAVISAFANAYATKQYQPLEGQLDNWNSQQGCPLN
jgi:hypothetical protein